MPLPLLTAHVHMIPRIDAGEALSAAVRASIPHMVEGDRRRQLSDWEKEAGGRLSVRPKTRAQLAMTAAQHGIGLKVKR